MNRGEAVTKTGNTKKAHVSIRRALRKIIERGQGRMDNKDLDDILFLVAAEIVERRKAAE